MGQNLVTASQSHVTGHAFSDCVTPMEGLVSLPEEFHNAIISRASPLAVLLPSTQGPGLCAYVLLQFLFSRHNDLLQRCCPLLKQT